MTREDYIKLFKLKRNEALLHIEEELKLSNLYKAEQYLNIWYIYNFVIICLEKDCVAKSFLNWYLSKEKEVK